MAINIPTINEKFLDNNGQVNSTWYNYLRTGGASNIGDVLPNFFIVSGAYIQASNYWLNLSVDNGWLSGDTYQGAYADLLKLSDASGVNIRFTTSDARDSEIATYGESGAFVLDTNNKRFKIPMVTKTIGNLSTLADIGTVFGNSAASGSAVYAGVKFPYFMKVGNKTIEASTVDLKKEAEDQKAAISSLGQAQLEAINAAGIAQVDLVNVAGAAQVNAITSSGTIQYDAITLNGTTWKNDIIATGTLWKNDIIATGSAQVGLVESAGTTQTGLVNTAGDTQVGLVEDEGDTQVARVISEGNTQVGLVETEGAEQIAIAEAAADEAAGYAAQAGTSALPLFTPLYLDYNPENSGYVLSDGTSYVSGSVYSSAYNHLVAEYNLASDTSETVGGVTVTYRRAPDGHKIIDVSNLANYQGVLSATGTAWYYVLDQANTRFMLPFTNWFIQGGATTAGSMAAYQEAGLPNITGSFITDPIGSATGAFSQTNVSSSLVGVSSAGSTDQRVSFNASSSNAIYGSSTTVQPKTNKLALYFVCGNTVVDEYLIDANGLADKNIGNLTSLGKKTIAEYAMPSNTYDTLTLGASGSNYTAPANGYYYLGKTGTAAAQFMTMDAGNIATRGYSAGNGTVPLCFLPVKKGDIVNVAYNMGGSTVVFRFVYAQGEV